MSSPPPKLPSSDASSSQLEHVNVTVLTCQFCKVHSHLIRWPHLQHRRVDQAGSVLELYQLNSHGYSGRRDESAASRLACRVDGTAADLAEIPGQIRRCADSLTGGIAIAEKLLLVPGKELGALLGALR
jgi:hypothetical protein